MNCGGELYAETSRSCSPSLFLDPQAASVLHKESCVHPLFVVAIPLLLIGVGMDLEQHRIIFRSTAKFAGAGSDQAIEHREGIVSKLF